MLTISRATQRDGCHTLVRLRRHIVDPVQSGVDLSEGGRSPKGYQHRLAHRGESDAIALQPARMRLEACFAFASDQRAESNEFASLRIQRP
jgi:hypothetical protein